MHEFCLGKAAIPIMWQFFERWGSAEETRHADWRPIADLLHPLGLYQKRAKMLIRFSGHSFFVLLCSFVVQPFYSLLSSACM
jgi:hypothetical protein